MCYSPELLETYGEYVRDDYEPEAFEDPDEPKTVTWVDMLEHWDAIETDFQAFYHLDLTIEADRRNWRWFEIRVMRLLSEPERCLLPKLLGFVPKK